MTNEEAIKKLEWALKNNTIYDENEAFEYILAVKMGIEALEQEPCEDCISRAEALKNLALTNDKDDVYRMINSLPSIQPKPGHCKDCQYFEYDSVSKVDGIPLIVAHEICKKWGDGCKTSEDGYCFLFEPNCEAKMEKTDDN